MKAPKDKAWYNKGIILSKLGNHEKAVEYLAKAYLLKENSGENIVFKPANNLGEVDEIRCEQGYAFTCFHHMQ